MTSPKTCTEWISYGFVGHDGRAAGPCGQPVYVITEDGQALCRGHYDRWHAGQVQFQEMVAGATRHYASFMVGLGPTSYSVCECGAQVHPGENHPWQLPAKLEDAKAAEGLAPCLKCAFRWKLQKNYHVDAIFCDCDEGWIPCP